MSIYANAKGTNRVCVREDEKLKHNVLSARTRRVNRTLLGAPVHCADQLALWMGLCVDEYVGVQDSLYELMRSLLSPVCQGSHKRAQHGAVLCVVCVCIGLGLGVVVGELCSYEDLIE